MNTIKISQKRTCNGCKALVSHAAQGCTCTLGYPLDSDNGIPSKPCPKPTTNENYCIAHTFLTKSKSKGKLICVHQSFGVHNLL